MQTALHPGLRQANPHAPPAYQGLAESAPGQGYFDQSFDYVYDVTLTASQLLSDQQGMDDDADFALRALVIASNTGVFSVQLSDSNFYYIQSALTASALFQGDAASPYAFIPEIMIPAGGRIGILIRDDSAAPNTIQIVFRGVKRYPVAA